MSGIDIPPGMTPQQYARMRTQAVVLHLERSAQMIAQLKADGIHTLEGLSWAAYCEKYLHEPVRDINRHIEEAEGQRKLESLNRANLPTDISNSALRQIAKIPDELVAAVIPAATNEYGKITAAAVSSVLSAASTIIASGAVETADGDMLAVSDVLGEYVQQATRRPDSCWWVVSRATGNLREYSPSRGYVDMRVIIPADLVDQIAHQYKSRFVISIGIEADSADDA